MAVILDVRNVFTTREEQDESVIYEAMPFAASLASLMEAIGVDPMLLQTTKEGKQISRRAIYDKINAGSGMSFGLLWHEEHCYSSLDLTLVDEHNSVIEKGFEILGYSAEILDKSEKDKDALKQIIVNEINQGRPVLAFGIVGPPECSLICGYDQEGDVLLGWSHFQSKDPSDLWDNGMFLSDDWYDTVWKLVRVKEKDKEITPTKSILKRGLGIARNNLVDGYYAGAAAYDAWNNYVKQHDYEQMEDSALEEAYRYHHLLIGSHMEARQSLGRYLKLIAHDDSKLLSMADLCDEVVALCLEVWQVAGGQDIEGNYKKLKDMRTREQLDQLMHQMKKADGTLTDQLMLYVLS